jgi:hypothetical protein
MKNKNFFNDLRDSYNSEKGIKPYDQDYVLVSKTTFLANQMMATYMAQIIANGTDATTDEVFNDFAKIVIDQMKELGIPEIRKRVDRIVNATPSDAVSVLSI